MRDVADLHVELRRSRWRIAFVAVATLATMMLFAMLPIAWSIRTSMLGACTFVAACELAAALRAEHRRLTLGMDRRIIVERAGRERAGIVLDATYVTQHLACVVWRETGSWRSRVVAIPRDALTDEEHRRLRIWLRYSRVGSTSSESIQASAASWLKGDLAT